MFAALEAKIKAFAARLDGEAARIAAEARDAALTELDAVKAEAAKVGPLLTVLRGDLEQAVAAAEPGVRSAVDALIVKAISDAEAIFAPKM